MVGVQVVVGVWDQKAPLRLGHVKLRYQRRGRVNQAVCAYVRVWWGSLTERHAVKTMCEKALCGLFKVSRMEGGGGSVERGPESVSQNNRKPLMGPRRASSTMHISKRPLWLLCGER